MKKILIWTGAIILVMAVSLIIFVALQTRERNKDYSLNLSLPETECSFRAA